MANTLSLHYQLTIKIETKMKKIIKNTVWKIRQTLYATMVMLLSLSIPALCYMELSHIDTNKEITVPVNSIADQQQSVTLEKQS